MAALKQAKISFGGKITAAKAGPDSSDDEKMDRSSLRYVAQETKKLLPGLLLTRPDAKPEGYLCKEGLVAELNQRFCPKLPKTKVRVIDADTIDTAIDLMLHSTTSSQKPVCVLNMANAYHVGGGWLNGALAQEEALCYRSSLYLTLKKNFYPLPERSAIYSPSVLIIRESLSNGHRVLDCRNPQSLHVMSAVSVAAVDRPPISRRLNGLPAFADQKDRELMEDTIRIVLRTAIRNKHRQIILGALGCGAFGNPKEEVAEMFRSILTEPEFSGGWWEDVVFAVLDGGKHGNFNIFHKALDGLKV